MKQTEHVDEIMGKWREDAEQGRMVDPQSVLESHPEHADELAGRFAAQALVDDYFADADGLPLVTPEKIGDYRIIGELGRGGMGVVYEAIQESMRRKVALKVLYPTIATTVRTRKRFEREARLTGRLHHSNVVTVYAMGQDNGNFYFAMELIEGRPLDEVIRHLRSESRGESTSQALQAIASDLRGRGRYERIAEKIAGVADALHLAHSHGVVHRDVKPSNLVLAEGGELKLTDFGLAQLTGENLGITRTGEVLGTPLYMSPEQVRAQREGVDQRTDVYSLGATLYELLSLVPVHNGADVGSLCSQILTEAPRPLRVRAPEVPKDLATIVHKALQKERGDRYASAGDMASDLRAFAEGRPISARPLGVAQRSWRAVKRRRVRSALVAMVLLLGVVGVWLKTDADRADDRRRELEYVQVLEQAYIAAGPIWGSSGWGRWAEGARFVARAQAVEKLFDRAIELDPGPMEPWLGRAMVQGRNREDRLRDLAESTKRGLRENTAKLARLFIETDLDTPIDVASREDSAAVELFLEGCVRTARGQRKEGIKLFSQSIRKAPRNAMTKRAALIARCVAARQVGDWSLVLEGFAALRELGAPSPALLVELAHAWRMCGPTVHAEKAEVTFQEALTRAEEPLTETEWLWLLHTVDETWHQAWIDAIYDAGASANPKSAVILAEVARQLTRRDPTRALALSKRTLRLSTASAAARLRVLKARAQTLGHLGRDAECAKVVREILAENPHDDVLFYAVILGVLNPETARTRVLEALKAQPWNPRLFHTLCYIHEHKGEPEQVERFARRGLQYDPSYLDLYPKLAWALTMRGQRAEALKVLKRGLKLGPTHPPLLIQRAMGLNNLGRFSEALSVLDAADKGTYRVVKTMADYARGFAHDQLGDRERALDAYTKYADDWNTVQAHVMCARMLRHLLRDAEASEALDRALAYQTTWLTDLFLRADEATNQGRLDLARKDAAAATQRYPADPNVAFLNRRLEAFQAGFVPRGWKDHWFLVMVFQNNDPVRAYHHAKMITGSKQVRDQLPEGFLLTSATMAAKAMRVSESEEQRARLRPEMIEWLREWRDRWHLRLKAARAASDPFAAKDAETLWKNRLRDLLHWDEDFAGVRGLPEFQALFTESARKAGLGALVGR